MKFQNPKIILFIDQCSAHPDLQLSNVRVEFFPANCTSKLQPCDLGIIRSFKVFYRKQLVRKAVAELENGNLNDACKLKLSVLEAMHFISAAWRNVTQKCISHCFEESGIVASNEPLTDAGLDRLDSENDNETVSYDFDEYNRENLAACEAERTTAPSVDDVMDFSSADADEQEDTEAQPVPSFNTALRKSGIVASNEPLTDAGLDRLDSENDNETVSYDFDEYIRENLATCEAERTTAPSVDDVMDFSSADEDEQEETEAQPVPSFNTALRIMIVIVRTAETTAPRVSLTSSELFSIAKAKNKSAWLTPPSHNWYQSG
ncbi:major centromere autoantigen B [Parasteatoda tepidariorum]|uniref:major centromere autoantigen B n=1 Tax=Parasteatoda tepidariorum TaxID=114398 RepID=UPI0039BC4C5F